MSDSSSFKMGADVVFSQRTKFDIKEFIEANNETDFNHPLVQANDSVFRLGVWEGEFPFHKHEDEDELFFVLEGDLLLDVEDETHALGPGQGFVVPKGLRHRTRAKARVVVLMSAKTGVLPASG